MAEWDYFISHASEDKQLVAAPLARVLRDAHFKVWYDDFALRVGDSLSNTIAKGLRRADYGIVILSPHFFAKAWPRRELDALTSREGGGFRLFGRGRDRDRIILPVWYDVTVDDVQRHAPQLSDRKGVATDRGLQAVAEQLVRATYPERLKDLPLTNVNDEADHLQAQAAFHALLDRAAPLRDLRLYLSAYHSLLHSIVGYHPQLIPAYKLECSIPFDFVLFVPQGITGAIEIKFITLGPLEGTAQLPQLLDAIRTALGPRQPMTERAADASSRLLYAGEYVPLIAAVQRLQALIGAADADASNGMRNVHWDRPHVWQFSFLVIAGRRRIERIDEERDALLKSVDLPVEIASYDRLLD